MMIDVIDNPRIPQEQRKKQLRPDKLQGGMFCGVSDITRAGLIKLGVEPPSHSHTILADMSGRDMGEEASRDYMVNRVAEIMQSLLTSEAVSSNHKVREALVDTIRQQFVSMRPLEQKSSQIEGR